MAHLLFRIGRASALRPFVAIVAWLVFLATAGGAFLTFGGTLTDSFSIPGTETERVTEQLAQEIDGLDGGSASVVFRTEDGSAFTEEQQGQIADALAGVEGSDQVVGTLDPFATEAERAEQAAGLAAGEQQIADARAELAAGEEQVTAGQAELDAGAAQLEQGQAQLDQAIAAAHADGTYEFAADEFAAQQAELDAQVAAVEEQQVQLDAARAELEAGAEELETQAAQLDLATQMLNDAAGIRAVSEDGSMALGMVNFDRATYELPPEIIDAAIEQIEAAPLDGIRVDFGTGLTADVGGILGIGEVVGVAIAFIVLMVMMRTLLPAVQPIITSVLGVGVGVATALAFSGAVEMSSVTPVLGVMLALAVGIDYSLFIVNRHRQQLQRGMSVAESVGLANGTSGNAVVFAGATVIIALLALNVTGVPFLGVMGTVAAFCVLIAVLTAVTLTPAILGLIGMRALSRKARARIGAAEHGDAGVRPMRTGRAVAALAVSAIALLVIGLPAQSMRLGLPGGEQEPADSTQYQAYMAISEDLGEGLNGTLLVTAELRENMTEDEVLPVQVAVASALMEHPDVVAVAPVGASDDGDFLAFQVIPVEGPSSASTQNLVHDLRGLSPLSSEDGGADGAIIGVAGEASGAIDVSEKLDSVLPLYLAVVVGLSVIILIVVFRSLVVPLIATAGFVLSLFAAFGAVTAVYQWGWLSDLFGVHSPGPILSFLPILLTGILFGLAMDYQLFIATGMRESYVHGQPARLAVVTGLRHGRAVVTAAAIIMASVFGGFVFSHLAMIRPMGFGLAIGVLFDAFVVRMVIVPSLMHLAGDKAWWLPGWLDRLLPNVDVEGSALEREHPFPVVDAEAEAPARS